MWGGYPRGTCSLFLRDGQRRSESRAAQLDSKGDNLLLLNVLHTIANESETKKDMAERCLDQVHI